jgi:hypothetical protein
MTSQTTSQPSSIRAFLVAIALLLASIFATNAASASTLAPAFDMGAPGGGGDSAQVTDDIEIVARGQLSEF